MKRLLVFLFVSSVVLTTVLQTTTTSAAVLLTGDLRRTLLVQPSSLEEGAFETSGTIWFSPEKANVTLAGPLSLDITQSGTYDSFDLTQGVARPGQVVSSFIMHFDPVGSTLATGLSGSATFDQDVLGLIVMDDTLDGTDDEFAVSGRVYPTGYDFRGLELSSSAFMDAVTLSADRRTVTINRLGADAAIDQLRIITVVPEPATLAMLLLPSAVFCRRRSPAEFRAR